MRFSRRSRRGIDGLSGIFLVWQRPIPHPVRVILPASFTAQSQDQGQAQAPPPPQPGFVPEQVPPLDQMGMMTARIPPGAGGQPVGSSGAAGRMMLQAHAYTEAEGLIGSLARVLAERRFWRNPPCEVPVRFHD